MIPKVSIIIPSYNCSKFIDLSVKSCLGQDYSNIEIIVVDNESNDDSWNKILNLKKSNPSLIIDTAKNLYQYSWQEPVEKAWSLMSGDYFTIVGADDIIEDFYISNCISIMQKNKLEMMQSRLRCFSKLNVSLLDVINIHSELGHFYSSIEDHKRKMLQYCCVASPSVVYDRRVLDNYLVEWKGDTYYGSSDYYLYCSLISQGVYIYPHNEYLGYLYRIHENQSSQKISKNVEEACRVDNLLRSTFRKKWNM